MHNRPLWARQQGHVAQPQLVRGKACQHQHAPCACTPGTPAAGPRAGVNELGLTPAATKERASAARVSTGSAAAAAHNRVRGCAHASGTWCSNAVCARMRAHSEHCSHGMALHVVHARARAGRAKAVGLLSHCSWLGLAPVTFEAAPAALAEL